jgi:hypothetical protein
MIRASAKHYGLESDSHAFHQCIHRVQAQACLEQAPCQRTPQTDQGILWFSGSHSLLRTFFRQFLIFRPWLLTSYSWEAARENILWFGSSHAQTSFIISMSVLEMAAHPQNRKPQTWTCPPLITLDLSNGLSPMRSEIRQILSSGRLIFSQDYPSCSRAGATPSRWR